MVPIRYQFAGCGQLAGAADDGEAFPRRQDSWEVDGRFGQVSAAHQDLLGLNFVGERFLGLKLGGSVMGLASSSEYSDCRIVVFYRVIPARAAVSLPVGVRLHIVNGYAVGGIAIARRRSVNSVLPPFRLVAAKDVLHFLSAVKVRRGQCDQGAIVMRRDTSSRWNAWVGRGWHWRRESHHARVDIVESTELIHVKCDSDDHKMHLAFSARPQREAEFGSMFQTTDQLLQTLPYDPRAFPVLRGARWKKQPSSTFCRPQLIPLRIEQLKSSLFCDPRYFADGAAQFDSAYQLRDDEVVWVDQGSVCCDAATA